MQRVWLLVGFAVLIASPQASAVTIEWVTVGDPGNAPDTEVMSDGTTGYGSVADVYRISKYETTNAQYAEFLNAKAASDPLGLYNTSMGSPTFGWDGITRSGSSGSYSYSAIAGRENRPVNYVSFYDSLRFSNWLHNGQGSGDTETGAYTLLGGTPIPSNGSTVTRNAGANIFLKFDDNKLHTPTPDCFLDGITRRTVIKLAKTRGIEIVERTIMPDELAGASEVFLTGTAAEVTPVGRIDEHTYTPGRISQTLMEDYETLVGKVDAGKKASAA